MAYTDWRTFVTDVTRHVNKTIEESSVSNTLKEGYSDYQNESITEAGADLTTHGDVSVQQVLSSAKKKFKNAKLLPNGYVELIHNVLQVGEVKLSGKYYYAWVWFNLENTEVRGAGMSGTDPVRAKSLDEVVTAAVRHFEKLRTGKIR